MTEKPATLLYVNFPIEHMPDESKVIQAMEARGFARDGAGTDGVTRDLDFHVERQVGEEERARVERELNEELSDMGPLVVTARPALD